jgi:solute carrier family 35 protein F1/2
MAKTTGIETHAHPVGESYKAGDEGMMVSDESRSMEMRGEGGEDVDPEVVAAGIEALERKRTKWYSYFLTRDFWIVLAIG